MRCRILHESEGRIRVHLVQCNMTLHEADVVQYYLLAQPGVLSAKVSERTCDAIVRYRKTPGTREALIRAFAVFHYDDCQVQVPEHTGREVQHTYVDRMFWQVTVHFAKRFFLPLPIRMVLSVIRAVPFVLKGLHSLLHGHVDVHVLDAASVSIALAQGDFDTASSVMFLLGIGDLMEEWTRRKSLDDLASAMSLHVDQVWLKAENGEEVLTPVGRVKAGEEIVARAGNMIPLDGIVTSGSAMVNQSSITGEPLAVPKKEGAAVFASTVLEEGELVIRVTKNAGNSKYDQIVTMIEDSQRLRSTTEERATDLADRLVPATFLATGLTYLVTRNVTKAYSILMVDYCCALKLSMPISVLSAMREAQQHHIRVKGGKFMENFAAAKTIVFDKTGTLTKACPKVREVVPFGGQDAREMLRLAACLEEHFPHSIANAVVQEAKQQGLSHEERHSKVQYVVAHGIASMVDGQQVRIGSYHFIFEDEKAKIPAGEEEKFASLPEEYSHLYLAIGGMLSAVILIEDEIREEAKSAIAALHEAGFTRVVMLTGDSERTARAVAAKLGIDDYRAEVLPEDKAAFIEAEHKAGRKVVMVGDGINDSPALSAADVGVAIESGAAIAREIADVTISGSGLQSLVTLRLLCNALQKRTKHNYGVILGFNSTLILLAMFGVLTPTATAVLHNGSTILIGLHSMTDLLPKQEDEEEGALPAEACPA
ncbi:MAG: heavy metal translocating P-type ATPase [Lachnospiraceae bacterium]